MASATDNVQAGIAAAGLHVVIVLAMVLGVSLRTDSPLIAANIIEGVVIESADFAVQPLPQSEPLLDEPPVLDEPEEVEPEETEPQVDVDALAAEREAAETQRKIAEEAEQKQIAERQAEAKRLEDARLEAAAEQERLAEAEQKALEQRKLEAERQAKEQQEAEAERQAAQRRKAEAERKALAEQKAAAERARKAQQQRDRRADAEAELQANLAAEEQRRQAVDSGLLAQYKLKIKQKIQRNWSPPPLAGPVTCRLRVRQLRTGDVISVEQVDCNGNAALERSLEAAANKASPFPRPGDESLFDPILVFEFESDE